MATTFTSDGIIYITDPLTTIFTPAEWCSTRLYTSTNEDDTTWYQRDLAVVHKSGYGSLGRTTECYWPNIQNHHSTSVVGAYSPGVCPSGYTANASAVAGSPATTSAWCCPYGMARETWIGGGCTSLVTTPTTVALNSGEFTTIREDFTARDYVVYIEWADSDLSVFTPAGAPTQARMTAPPPSSSKPPSSGATPKNPAPAKTSAAGSDEGGRSLSSGAEAGIGVGVAIAVILIVALAAWLLIRRRKRRQQFDDKPSGYESRSSLKQDSLAYPGSEFAHNKNGMRSPGHYLNEADSSARVEVDGSPHRRPELEGDGKVHEMDNGQSS